MHSLLCWRPAHARGQRGPSGQHLCRSACQSQPPVFRDDAGLFSLSCHSCRRIVPPKPAPGHGQSAFGLNKAPLRRLTHEISAAASSPPGSPLTPVSAPAASSASGWCIPVCPGSTSCFRCLFDPCQCTCCLCCSRCVPEWQPRGEGRRVFCPVCWLLVQAVTWLLQGRLLPLLCQVHGIDRDPTESSLCAFLGTLCF